MTQLLAWERDFPLSQNFHTVRGPPSLLFNKYCSSFNRLMWLKRNVDQSPPSSADVESECCYTSIPTIHVHGMYAKESSIFKCIILMKSDYSSFTVDVLYPIVQQWPWWPIAATERVEQVEVLPSLPPNKPWMDKLPHTLLHNQHTILHQHLFDTNPNQLSYPEEGGSMFLWNIRTFNLYMVLKTPQKYHCFESRIIRSTVLVAWNGWCPKQDVKLLACPTHVTANLICSFLVQGMYQECKMRNPAAGNKSQQTIKLDSH